MFDQHPVQPSSDGRNDLADTVEVYAHHSSLHDGITLRVVAPPGTRITINLNHGQVADLVAAE